MAADLLLGAACPGCGSPGLGLCPSCLARLTAPLPRRVTPTPCPPGFPDTVAAAPYDELLRALIPAHKERQAWLLTGLLADRLALAAGQLIAQKLIGEKSITGVPVVLVPVPSAPAAVRQRGRDATGAIAAAAARRLRRDLRHPVTMIKLLRPTRRLADQTELSEQQRRLNLAGAYAARSGRIPQARKGSVLLVDDLVTTGSSLTEARRAVADTGLEVIGAAVIAATGRRRPQRPPTDPDAERVLDRSR